MEFITAAGNTIIPAYLVLRDAGFDVSVSGDGAGEKWEATHDGLTIVGDSPLQILALFAIREKRGVNWKPTDSEIESFLKRFGK